jgi:hypothetical protein
MTDRQGIEVFFSSLTGSRGKELRASFCVVGERV